MAGLIGVIVMCVVLIAFIFLPYGKCPKCGGELELWSYDGKIDRNIYKCKSCRTEYI